MIFFKLGVRNLLRNKRRTVLSGLAIGLGLAALIIIDGFWLGMIDNMEKSVTTTYIGHVQLHHPKFQESYDSFYAIAGGGKLLAKIEQNPRVKAVSGRTLAIGMLSSSQDSFNVSVVGVTPEYERDLSLFSKRILQGSYLSSEQDILIGEGLRKKLNLELGDRLVLTVSEVKTGEIVQELFRLTGVFGIGNKQIDQGVVLVQKKQLQKLLNLNEIHEIAFRYQTLEQLGDDQAFIDSLKGKSIKVETWKELVPSIVSVIEMSGPSMSIMGLVLFTLVALGILNTMFMSLFERVYEFGVLQAVGTKKKEILWIVLSEASALGVVSVIFGLLIALCFAFPMAFYGIDYSGIEFGEMTFTEKIYFVFDDKQIIVYPILTFLFTLAVSFYPAWYLLKKKPADTLRRSL